MKKVPFDGEHITFMAHAINYLKNNGVYTPDVIRTKKGKAFIKLKGEFYVVFEAVHGKPPNYKYENELEMILKSLATFHKASKGIESPTGSFPSFLLKKWKSDFRNQYKRLLQLKKQVLQANEHNEFDQLFLLNVDTFLNQCQTAITMLEHPSFDLWVEQTERMKTLCHQDYAAGNLLIGNDHNLYVFDMDSLTVDLPIRDIRNILNKVMRKEAAWDLKTMIKMMKAYQEVNPLTKEQYHILAAELFFPHLFYGQVKQYYGKQDESRPFDYHLLKLKKMIATEKNKVKVIQKFLKRLDKVIGTG